MAASLAFAPGWDPSDLPIIPLLAGIAASRACGADLKWPNDVLVGGDKVGGILSEHHDGVVTVGFGLNLWWPEAPEGRAGLHEDDPGPDRALELATAWADQLLALASEGPQWPVDEYRNRCTTIGRTISWEPDGRGTVVDVDPSGHLVVHTGRGVELLAAGAVRHLRA